MENLEVRKFDDCDSAGIAAANLLSTELKILNESNTSVLVLLSGGSALEFLDHLDESSFGKKVTIGVLDERYSENSEDSNFIQMLDTEFVISARANGVSFIDTRVINNDTHENHAKRFEDEILNWKSNNPDGKIIVTQGMGADGHTSGVMPFPEDEEFFENTFNSKDRFIVHYDAKSKNKHRLRTTTSLSFLRNEVDLSIFFVCGEEKLPALQKVFSGVGSLSETPARIVKEIKKVVLFTDLEV